MRPRDQIEADLAVCHCGKPELDDERAEGMCADCRLFLLCDADNSYCDPVAPPPECDCVWKEPHGPYCTYDIRLAFWEAKQRRLADEEHAALLVRLAEVEAERDAAGLRWGEHYNAEIQRLTDETEQFAIELCDERILNQQLSAENERLKVELEVAMDEAAELRSDNADLEGEIRDCEILAVRAELSAARTTLQQIGELCDEAEKPSPIPVPMRTAILPVSAVRRVLDGDKGDPE